MADWERVAKALVLIGQAMVLTALAATIYLLTKAAIFITKLFS